MKAEKIAAIVAASAACCTTHAFQNHVHRRMTPPSSIPASPLFAKKKAKGGGGGKGFGAPRARSSEEASDRANDGNAPLVATAPDIVVVPSSSSEPATDEDRGDGGAAARKGKGDAVRGATGIRPSLHPTAVNCVAEALRLRCRGLLGTMHDTYGAEIDRDAQPASGGDAGAPPAEPLQIALHAAGLAIAAIDRRKAAAKTDDTTDAFTTEEGQAISGRVVGVVMRFLDLERTMAARVAGAEWVGKYGEEGSFGVLKEECRLQAEEGVDAEATAALENQLVEALTNNPLLRMNRAECLLALFLETVERPRLVEMGEEVPGGSAADFIDADRREALLLE